MSKADDIFWKEFGGVLVLLTVFGFAMFFLARAIAGDAFEKAQLNPAAVAERIAPVGDVRVGDPTAQAAADAAAQPMTMAAAAPAAAPAAASAAPKSGAEVYQAACLACHLTGAANAPKLGDKAAWEPRAAAGLDALVASAIAGKGAMPPRGGMATLSDEEIRAAVVHILEGTGIEAGG